MLFKRLDWTRDGADWPNREASRFVTAGRLRWHVQIMGEGPVLLLIHGTAASSHSFRDLAPILAEHFTCVVPDLPGHGFTQLPPLKGLSMQAMAHRLQALLAKLELAPDLVAGHSAGAALLAYMCLRKQIAPAALLSLNGAMMPYAGSTQPWFSPLMRVAVWNPVTPHALARRADRHMVRRFLDSTGSSLDERGHALYARLAGNARHVVAALGMMASWDLQPVQRQLPQLGRPILFLVGSRDRTIPPIQARQLCQVVPDSELVLFEGLGHLAHEEDPQATAEVFLRCARDRNLLPSLGKKSTVKSI